jgi:hypothetical protein
MVWLRYVLLLLIVPAYLIALRRGRWTMLPLWLVSASVTMVQYAMSFQQSPALGPVAAPSAILWIAETTKILLIPVAVQFALMLKSRETRSENQPSTAPRPMVAAFDTGEI